MSSEAQAIDDIVRFEFNQVVECALKYPTGKEVSTRFGKRILFTLTDERKMFLDLGPAQRINELQVKPGETFCVSKKRGERGNAEWRVWLTAETEQARARAQARKPLEQQLQESLDMRNVVPPSYEQTVPAAGPTTQSAGSMAAQVATRKQPGTTSTIADIPSLIDATNELVDAYAAVLERTLTKHQGRIKPDECRSLLLSVYIQRGKAGGSYAA